MHLRQELSKAGQTCIHGTCLPAHLGGLAGVGKFDEDLLLIGTYLLPMEPEAVTVISTLISTSTRQNNDCP